MLVFRVCVSVSHWLKFSQSVEGGNSLPDEKAPEGNSLEKREAVSCKTGTTVMEPNIKGSEVEHQVCQH